MKLLTFRLTMVFSISNFANDCTITITEAFPGNPVHADNSKHRAEFKPLLEKALTSKGFTVVKESNNYIQAANTLVVLDYATCSHKGSECVGLYSQLVLLSDTDYSCDDGQCVFEAFTNKIPLTPRTSFVKAVKKIPYCK